MKIHVRIQDKTFEVKLGDVNARPIQVEVDGEIFEVWPQEMLIPSASQRSSPVPQVSHPVQPVEDAHDDARPTEKSMKVLAPIPGVIIEICVQKGDTVKYGQELCVLEAMKMKNSIRSNQKGIIGKILVSMGEQVKQSQELISFRKEG